MQRGDTGTVKQTSINVRRPANGQAAADGQVVGILALGSVVVVVDDFGDGWPFIQAGAGASALSGYIDQTNVDWGQQAPPDTGGGHNGGNAADLTTPLGREAYIFNYWLRKGFTDFQAAAAVGNFKGEAGPPLDPSIFGGWHNQAFGLAQWLSARKDGLFGLAKSRNVDLTDKNSDVEARVVVEMDYVWQEFHNDEHPSFTKIVQAASLEEAANGFAAYERWAGWEQGRAGDLPNHWHYRFADDALIKAKNGAYSGTSSSKIKFSKIAMALGDSLGVGVNEKIGAAHVQITQNIAAALGTTVAQVGAAPATIEKNVAAFVASPGSSSFLDGNLICLSSGASNAGALAEVDHLDRQMSLLTKASAFVVVLGVAKNGVFPSGETGSAINDRISTICDAAGVRFTGGFVGSGPGNIHPASYSVLVSLTLGAANV